MLVARVNYDKIREFVLSRQNEDGGFAFCKPLPSTLAETYYAVSILTMLEYEVPRREKLVEFLRSRIQKEVYTLYYTFHTLNALGEDLPDYSDFVLNKLKEVTKKERGDFADTSGITATYTFELPNVLREIYVLTSILNLFRVDVPEETKLVVYNFKRNGGYGSSEPNLKETYYAVYVLRDRDAIGFVKRFECEGGFAKSPGGYPPYLEETYYALSIFKMLEYKYDNPQTQSYIASLQNPNGGFRRSIHGGISTLEDSYYAVSCLKYLGLK